MRPETSLLPKAKKGKRPATSIEMHTDLKDQYTGHYAAYNVPYHFQQVVINIRRLHDTLRNEKYWLYFFHINEALTEYHKIIYTNDFKEGIELRIGNLSTIIQTQINIIVELKKTAFFDHTRSQDKQNTFVITISEITKCLSKLTEQLKLGISGDRNPNQFPPPGSTTHPAQLFPCSQIKEWINEIANPPQSESCWRTAGHAFYYKKTISIIAIGFFTFSMGTGAQSLVDYFLKDTNYQGYARIGLPASTLIIGTAIAFFALYKSSRARKQMRKQYLSELKRTNNSVNYGSIFSGESLQRTADNADYETNISFSGSSA